MHVFPVETARLRMRPLSAEDEALYAHLYTDAETMRFIGTPLTAERAAKSFRVALAGMQRRPIERLFLTVIEKPTVTAVGVCSLQDYDARRRSVQAGVMLIAAARARGYSKEGLIGLIQQTFAALAVDELWVQVAADHIAGQRSAMGIGLTPCHDAAPGSGLTTHQVWSARRSSWLAAASSFQHPSTPAEQA